MNTAASSATPPPSRAGRARKKLKAAVYIAPEDISTSTNHIRQVAREVVREVPNMNPQRDALLVISFSYEAPATEGEYQRMGNIKVIRAEANRDLTIPELKHSARDNSFVVVGEPDVELRDAPNGPAGDWRSGAWTPTTQARTPSGTGRSRTSTAS